MSRPVLDVSHLKDSAFGHKGLIWWGTAGYMVIEGTMFLIVFVAYFYLRLRESMWPPSLPNPDAVMPTVNLLVMAVSLIPAHFAKRAAERCDITGVRPWLLALTLFSAAIVALRALEYPGLNCRWDDNAYASVTWVLLSLHTAHVATDVVENSVLLAVSYRKPPTRKRFVDFAENSLYWYFIVASFVPVYLTVYWAPRWL
jgi:cytochrome c oxidase subunit I+III